MSFHVLTIFEVRRKLEAIRDETNLSMRSLHAETIAWQWAKEREWYEAELARLRGVVASLSGSNVRLCVVPHPAARHRE